VAREANARIWEGRGGKIKERGKSDVEGLVGRMLNGSQSKDLKRTKRQVGKKQKKGCHQLTPM